MILQLLKGRGMVSGLFEKKRDAIPPHFKHCMCVYIYIYVCVCVCVCVRARVCERERDTYTCSKTAATLKTS
jgi:hypothetical protein